ncbi:TIGR02253 family HAD-type hydrolase [soil metagenome]
MNALDPQPELVLFDLDDTLCDYASARWLRLRIAFDQALDRLPRRPSVDLDMLARESIEMHPHGVDHFHELLAKHEVEHREAVEHAQHWYRTNRFYGLRLFPDALETLVATRRALPGRRIGMITNGPAETQRAKIELLGIRSYFDFILISGEFGVAKPDRKIFEEATSRGTAGPDSSVFIGDSPEFDMAGARNAGMPGVWMNPTGQQWSHPDPRPGFEARTLGDVRTLLGGDRSAPK